MTDTETLADSPSRRWSPGRPTSVIAVLAVVAVGVVVAATAWWGHALNDRGVRLLVDAAPFTGRWDWLGLTPLAGLLALAGAAVAVWPRAVERLRWSALLAACWLVSLGWGVALAISRGADGIWAPFSTGFEYLPLARRTDDLGSFVSTFTERLPSYPTHVRGHPPGPVIVFWALDQLRLGDAALGLLVFAVAASAAPAVLIAVRSLTTEDQTRRVAPFVGLLPAAIWWSSFDAALMGVTVWTVAAATVAVTAESGRRRLLAGALVGVLAGCVLVSTYGAPTLLMPVVAVSGWGLLRHRRAAAGPLTLAAAAATVPVLALARAGFSWIDGFSATRAEYWDGAASGRPYLFFLVANLAVAAVVVGPAAIGGIAGWRRERTWLLPAAATVGLIVADLSGYSKGEVERIWLPLIPWLAVAVIGLRRGRRATQAWLGAQLLVGIAVQAAVGSPW